MTSTQTDLTRFRVFGVRVGEALLAHIRTELHPDLEFPCATYNVDESRDGIGPEGRTSLTVKGRCAYGSRFEITIDTRFTGMTITATFTADVWLHGGYEQWAGFVDENQAGVMSLSGMSLRRQPCTA